MITCYIRQCSYLLPKLLVPTRQQPTLVRCLSISSANHLRVGPQSPDGPIPKRRNFKDSLLPVEWYKLIDKYPEFLPDPVHNAPLVISKQLDDMLARRAVIEIPEFYVGSILSVTCSDEYSDTKKNKFTGICIHRTGQMNFANFTLRNIIDGMGCEIRYDLYNPLILSIEVLKLEKRLDDSLIYLRDALPEYSMIPEDMKAVPHKPGSEVPVNKTRVKMKPWPWSRRWELHDFKGVEKLDNVPELFANRAKTLIEDPVYSYDLMLEYRRHCTEEMMYNICKRLAEHEKEVVQPRDADKSRRFIKVAKDSSMSTLKES